MGHVGHALQAVLPTLLLLLSGALLRGKNIITDSFTAEGDRLCMKLLLPALVFRSILNGKADMSEYMRSIGFSYIVIAVSVIAGVAIVPRLVSDRRRIAVIIQCLYRGNFTIYGIAFSQLLGGADAAAIASVIAAATLPALNLVGVSMYAHYSGKKGQRPLQTLKVVMKNPIIWAIALALILKGLRLTLPGFAAGFVSELAGIASPLAFILLGTRLRRDSLHEDKAVIGSVLIFKLIIMPAVFLPLAVLWLGITGNELIPVFLFTAAPCAITNYQLATQYHADEKLAGDLVMLSTVASTATICLIVSLLRGMGLI